MAQKNNIRSIRFSDEMAELIDRQVGDTFTQELRTLERDIKNARQYFKIVERRVKAIAEAAEQDTQKM